MLGVLRTAYPFCCGSRHHSYWPNCPHWLLRMFPPTWDLIHTPFFHGADSGLEGNKFPASCIMTTKFVWALGVHMGPWYQATSFSQQGCKAATPLRRDIEECRLTGNQKTLTRPVALGELRMKSKSPFHIGKMKRLACQSFSNRPHRFPRALMFRLQSVYV